MNLKVELQAYLEQYSPGGQGVFEYEMPDGSRVRDLVDALSLPDELASIVIIGGMNSDWSQELSEGDHVILIPPLAGG